jgi:hypothetical protein
MRIIRSLAKVLHSLHDRVAHPGKAVEKDVEVAQGEFLRPPSGQILWDKLERDAQIFSMRGWARLQEKEANDSDAALPEREIRRLCKAYVNSSSSERIALRDDVSPALCSRLQHFAWRMAVVALRTKSEEAIKLGLAAISIEDVRFDARETLGWLSLLYYAAERSDCDIERTFKRVGAFSGDRTSSLIRSFLSSPQELRDISVFGFGEGVSEQGPTLVNLPQAIKGPEKVITLKGVVTLKGVGENAGRNRQGVADERAVRERASDPSRP